MDPAQYGGGGRLSGAAFGSRRFCQVARLTLQERVRVAGSSGIKLSAERQGGDRTSRLSWTVGLETDVADPVGPRPSGG
jgi:hypothetical protein